MQCRICSGVSHFWCGLQIGSTSLLEACAVEEPTKRCDGLIKGAWEESAFGGYATVYDRKRVAQVTVRSGVENMALLTSSAA